MFVYMCRRKKGKWKNDNTNMGHNTEIEFYYLFTLTQDDDVL